jgi:hypothetical protein
MSFLFWFCQRYTRHCHRRRLRRPATCVPVLEVLEDRSLPSLFGPATTTFLSGTLPVSAAVGDFNGDGIPDLAVANEVGDNVSVLLGNGHGGFTGGGNFPAGLNPSSVAVGDFDGDGTPDLAVADASDFKVTILLNNGQGGFNPGPGSPVPSGNTARSVAVGDFNGDGTPDLAVANETDDTVSILLGDGHGGFRTAPSSPVAVGVFPFAVAVGDFNGDGTPDLAVVNAFSNTVSVLLGNGDGSLKPAVNYAVGSGPGSVAVGDFGNGHLDLAVTNSGSNTVSVLLGNGDGTFAPATNYPVGAAPASVAVGDFNRDGTPDLAVANAGSNSVSVLLGDGQGGFGKASNYAVGSSPSSVAVGDFHGDGGLDLAVANAGDDSVSVLPNQAPVTTTAVSASAGSAVAGQLVTYNATVTPSVPGQALTPTGLVSFLEDGALLGSATLDAAGQAQLTTLAAGTGFHGISAVYQGDPHFTGSNASPLRLLVNQGATSTLLTASAGPAVAGQPLTLTAQVGSALPTTATPTGSVLFLDNFGGSPVVLGTATLGGGVATLTTTALAPGSHALTAVYVGDNQFTGSTAAALAEAVNNPAPVLRGLDTTTLPEGSAGFTLTLNGSGFLSSSSVQWNGTPLIITAAGGTQIQVMVPPALLADKGTALVTVSNPGPGGGPSLPQVFTVTDAPLTAAGANISVLGNKSFSGVVATFTDGNRGATAADFTAIIIWDNGTASFATITGSAGNFTVSGSHTFGGFSNVHTVTVTIYDKGGSTAAVTDIIIDPPGPSDPQPAAGGDPAAAALPPVAPPQPQRRHGHDRRPAAHVMPHHRGHGRARAKRHHGGEPFAP